jgi:hypothetical protein
MRKGILVYISGAISPKNGNMVEENIAVGLRTFIELTKVGIPSFSPQLLAAFPSTTLIPYHIWMAYDFTIIDRSTHMLMLPNWEKSPGAVEEKAYAESLGMPVLCGLHELLELLDVRE